MTIKPMLPTFTVNSNTWGLSSVFLSTSKDKVLSVALAALSALSLLAYVCYSKFHQTSKIETKNSLEFLQELETQQIEKKVCALYDNYWYLPRTLVDLMDTAKVERSQTEAYSFNLINSQNLIISTVTVTPSGDFIWKKENSNVVVNYADSKFSIQTNPLKALFLSSNDQLQLKKEAAQAVLIISQAIAETLDDNKAEALDKIKEAINFIAENGEFAASHHITTPLITVKNQNNSCFGILDPYKNVTALLDFTHVETTNTFIWTKGNVKVEFNLENFEFSLTIDDQIIEDPEALKQYRKDSVKDLFIIAEAICKSRTRNHKPKRDAVERYFGSSEKVYNFDQETVDSVLRSIHDSDKMGPFFPTLNDDSSSNLEEDD